MTVLTLFAAAAVVGGLVRLVGRGVVALEEAAAARRLKARADNALFPTTDQDRTVVDLMATHLSATMCRVTADNGQGAYIIAPDGRVIA